MEGKPFIEFISTGRVRMREPMSGQPITNKNAALRLLRCFTGDWTEWLPIGVFLIRHSQGPILIDTGASPRCMKSGYFPTLGSLASVLNQLEVAPEDDIISQLATKGVQPTDLQAIVLTHLHHDHAGGLEDIVKIAPNVPIYIDPDHWEAFGKHPTYAALQGCTPNHWPEGFKPKTLQFSNGALGPWPRHALVTGDGQIVAVQTPGHVPGHVSILATGNDNHSSAMTTYLLTGDATYSLQLLENEEPDGINNDPLTAFKSLQLIKEFARQQDVVVVPSHDINAPEILQEKRIYKPN
ncbi:hypothetical protein ACJZ2D_016885 [Fusarium nematophilum]